MTTSTTPDTVILIHGLWMTPKCWEHWVERYTARGFKCLAPGWPGMEAEPEQLRRDPSPIAKLGLKQVIDHYDGLIRRLDKPPIIIGHSIGGAITQVLVDRGLGAAAVGVAPVAVRGVLAIPLSTLRVGLPILSNPLNIARAVQITAKQFKYSCGNLLSEAESNAAWERYAVPGVGGALFTAALANLNPGTPLKVDYKRSNRAPLLFIAGGRDHAVPASVNRVNAGKYRNSAAITAYKEYPARSHFTTGEPGWEEVADYALEWALNPVATGL